MNDETVAIVWKRGGMTLSEFIQTIVIENIEHTPKLDYNKLGAQHIQFTKQEEYGRYGFLPDIRS
ncbi:MAG: hypothetical protein SPJ59_02440 [Peptoniphilaceae bacterium]|nr:hypothetical protein [Peptoniphilaceae bacterium]